MFNPFTIVLFFFQVPDEIHLIKRISLFKEKQQLKIDCNRIKINKFTLRRMYSIFLGRYVQHIAHKLI